ncbi:ComEC/Rec2 family competence protein [Geomesophilobacter sediminis]|uniref:Metallo-beta-lactamase domain-containing protein n=1 Tax=Geomesophilobacter sediminis TaxID=2798584 RepID=A0A8J7J675_9BACT|nr:hypothetical protein [Geomesophilobacter sediminis]MBJ6724196.1 hypothetical protein [Geomesophilobacter sediminis]
MGYEIDFLPVGSVERSGDAICFRFGNLAGPRNEQTVVVLDGGFKESGVKLVEHIKSYYGTDLVDIVINSHPDCDHSSGLEVVLNELRVGELWMHQPWNHTQGMAKLFKDGRVTDNSISDRLQKSLNAALTLEQIAEEKGIPIIEPFYGLTNETGALKVMGPTLEYYESLLTDFASTPEPKQETLFSKALAALSETVTKIAEGWDFETLSDDGETTAENNSCAVLQLDVDGVHLVFTCDAGVQAISKALDYMEASGYSHQKLKFVQVPHHGSHRNVGPSVLNRLLGPKNVKDDALRTAFVSCAPDGEPKHPNKKVCNAFRRRGAHVHATQGTSKWHHTSDAPARGTYSASTPLPFYPQVEE